MSVQTAQTRHPLVFPRLAAWVVPAGVGGAIGLAVVALRPDLGVLAELSLAIKIHLATALAAFLLGVAMMTSRKGRTFHRVAGWVWVGIMLATAFASLFITGINGDAWSWIHILSGLTLVMAPLGLVMARRHKVRAHRFIMTSLFVGGMLIAGGFTFLPGRVMWQLFFG